MILAILNNYFEKSTWQYMLWFYIEVLECKMRMKEMFI